jgi:adenine-specific DNA-methyltransferase
VVEVQRSAAARRTESYLHDETAVLRPEVGTQPQFKRRKPPKKYRYDDSLSPALDWDGRNSGRDLGEWLLAQIDEAARIDPPHRFPEARTFGDIVVAGLDDALAMLKGLSAPFLNWSGKAERLSFDVPTLPLFVHERLSTKAILETLTAHERDRQLELQLFADPQLSLAQQLEAYEHTGGWVNRMILGDSLVVMNSMLGYEGLGGQVQMIYIDPPYGVKYGSNFQPFIRRRDVKDGSDDDMTREPEMVQAYRDTWDLGLHSYLTYLRDRLAVARDLLSVRGSVFVQISDENVHHVREVLDEIFGPENFCGMIQFRKTSGANSPVARVDVIASVADYLLWYARDRENLKYRQLYLDKEPGGEGSGQYTWVEFPGEEARPLTRDERSDIDGVITSGGRLLRPDTLSSPGYSAGLSRPFIFDGKSFTPPQNSHWKTTREGLARLAGSKRIIPIGQRLYYKRYINDFPVFPLTNVWVDTGSSGFSDPKLYAVQTNVRVIQRCLLMTTDPGDLVLDPTCGSGTSAYVAEQWGRRWITTDVSRVPLALARQRLLTATYPFYVLQDTSRGPAGGFNFRRRQNTKGEEVGGIVPHLTLKAIANAETPKEEVLFDRPEVNSKVTRVTGPFCVEATIPTPGEDNPDQAADGAFDDRLLEVLRRNPVLQLSGNKTITLADIRPPAKSLSLSAEAMLKPADTLVALAFGPENGAVSERLVYEAAREGHARSYAQLIIIGLAIEAAARELVEKCEDLVGIPATYVQATPDLVMGDLLKTMRSSQIFSVTGLPDVRVTTATPEEKGGAQRYQVELRGLDVFDPTTMKVAHLSGNDVPAWFLDTDYNEMCFLVSQAFFPRTSAWESLSKALRGEYADSVWEHLSGTASAPFEPGENRKIAVKVIDDRGNELLVVKSLDEAS